ncbi:sulfotransferase family 2 domain-containing protein [Thalassotalea piscium]|uniref:Sulfotransferase family protein n=1 Tax=Thalassotalea piscium TaxID=1230533 RepID=A0A7X0NG86_9GAMM|nr:sulfotransferase family 2 domain-containing protein [Thalassotalea piscium]MBB6542783.1 hypothetical protein [Thalassotalea piscium]
MSSDFPNFLRTADTLCGQVLNPESTRVLFHHLPKTAGSTFRAILDGLFNSNEICPAETHWELQKSIQDNPNLYRLFAGHFTYDVIDKNLKGDIWLTFLRSPVERVVSQYHNHLHEARQPKSWIDRVQNTKTEDIPISDEWREYHKLMKDYTLIDWVTSENRHANATACNLQTQSFINRYQTDETGCRIDKRDWSIYDEDLVNEAKRNLANNFQFIGLQEYFDLSLDIFSMTFGRYPFSDSSAFTTNLNIDKTLGSKYDLAFETRSLIEKRNSMDMELYQFAKELFFNRLRTLNKYYIDNDRLNRIASLNKSRTCSSNKVLNTNKIISIECVDYVQGFYSLERSGDKHFRWSGNESLCILELNECLKASTEYKVKVHAIAVLNEAVLESISVNVNGEVVSDFKVKKCLTGGYDVIFKVSGDAGSSVLSVQKIGIMSATEKEPTEQAGARQLGLAISSISIS